MQKKCIEYLKSLSVYERNERIDDVIHRIQEIVDVYNRLLRAMGTEHPDYTADLERKHDAELAIAYISKNRADKTFIQELI